MPKMNTRIVAASEGRYVVLMGNPGEPDTWVIHTRHGARWGGPKIEGIRYRRLPADASWEFFADCLEWGENMSKGHVAFVDKSEFFIRNGSVYRAPNTRPIMPDGYRCGRWECDSNRWREWFQHLKGVQSR